MTTPSSDDDFEFERPPISPAYQQVLDFAKDHPLPQEPHLLALHLLDVVTLLRHCQWGLFKRCDEVNISLSYHQKANPFPGAFLSSPALLMNTVEHHGTPENPMKSMGGYGAGCFFSYSHYHENSLAQVLLMSAFSPRTEASSAPLSAYLQAMMHLHQAGLIEKFHIYGSDLTDRSAEEIILDPALDQVSYASMSMTFCPKHQASLGQLYTPTAAKACELALTDMGQGVFSLETREKLTHLTNAYRAAFEAHQLHQVTRAAGSSLEHLSPLIMMPADYETYLQKQHGLKVKTQDLIQNEGFSPAPVSSKNPARKVAL